jgi:hypothetical protein
MILLGICVIALAIGFLRLVTQRTPLPTGSSYSAESNGAQALYTWIEAAGGRPRRLLEPLLRNDRVPATLLVLQPETSLDSTLRDTFDSVTSNGGTLIVAGDSLSWLLYVRNLGVTVEPVRTGATQVTTPDRSLTVPVLARYRVRAEGATPLLLDPAGEWVALRMPREHGSLVVVAAPELLLNAGLRDEQTARFVYREVVSPIGGGGGFAFDESHHSFTPPDLEGAPITLNRLLLDTAAGRALIYVAMLTFGYLLLSGRRLGPALGVQAATETRRTMYEHVQMLANLYRRAGHLSTVRAAFSKHYTRELNRVGAGSPGRAVRLAEAVARIETARTESDLIAAVAGASDPG